MITKTALKVGSWVYIPSYRTYGRIIEQKALWGSISFRVWLPSSNSIVTVEPLDLLPAQSSTLSAHHLTYLTAAARVADALTQDVLLAPIESSVIPLPHQIRALSRAISSDRVRYLLADEVGLGKTIEAGLIMRELKLRGLVKRTLIVVPRGLVTQWIAELAFHFNEKFCPIMSEDYKSLKKIFQAYSYEVQRVSTAPSKDQCSTQSLQAHSISPNPFRMFNQVIVSMDSVKPSENVKRTEGTSTYNFSSQDRFEDLIAGNWDLIIVDEAHRLGGSTDQVARYKLGVGLAEAAPYVLLLSATPHQGKTDAFRRVMSLLDPLAFPDTDSITRERVHPYVIRTEKRYAIGTDGKPLFRPRITELYPVRWDQKGHHAEQHKLYDAVTSYVREGYNLAVAENRPYIGFLMILLQRLAVSSVRAIKSTLKRRLEVLDSDLFVLDSLDDPETFYDLDGQDQLELLLKARLQGIRDEKTKVKQLLEMATECERRGPDAKAEALLEWIYRLQAEEGDPEIKLLVFTEFIPTQEMLYEFLTERGFKVVCLNGSMGMDERRKVQEEFARDARILISTDAGGEGINLQFCHVVINYDIPWNPMKLEQRIGRVDRIGQTRTVRAINFVHEESIEHRVLEVLEEKLSVIFKELGIDKTGDVLDSAQASYLFDNIYIETILNPDCMIEKVDEIVSNIRKEASEYKGSAALLGSTRDLDPHEAEHYLTHPLPHWLERMTVSYLNAYGGKAEKENGAWNLIWPDGRQLKNIVFSAKDYEKTPWARHVTIDNPNIRGLVQNLPRFIPCQPIPVVQIPGLSSKVVGFWGLWKITISAIDWKHTRIMPLFVSDDGRVFTPSARRIWDQFLSATPTILRHLDLEESAQAFEQFTCAAERSGKVIHDELLQIHREYIKKEREKILYAFTSQKKAIERIGLPQVRNYRLRQLAREKRRLLDDLDQRSRVVPEMVPIIIVRIEG